MSATAVTPVEKRGRGRPQGSKNRRARGPAVHRPVPALTPEEIFEMREVLHFVPHGESAVDKLIKAGSFPRPRYVGNKRIWSGAQLIAYRAALARGEAYVDTGSAS